MHDMVHDEDDVNFAQESEPWHVLARRSFGNTLAIADRAEDSYGSRRTVRVVPP